MRWLNTMRNVGEAVEAQRMVARWLRREHPRGRQLDFSAMIEIQDIPQQIGGVDCGVHVLSHMMNILRGEPLSDETGDGFTNLRRDAYASLLVDSARQWEPMELDMSATLV
jgi:Ulp1 family protease